MIAAQGTERGRGHIDSALINTHVFGLEAFESAFEVFRQKKENAAKAVLEC